MAAGSNVQVSIDSVSSNSVTVLCSITTSGRQEYGYIVIMDMDGVELTRSDGFTVYGNSSTTKTVSGLANGTYQASFYSDDYSELVSPYAQFTIGVQPPKIYGSVNGQTKSIQKIYGSVNGQTKLIRKLYGSVNGQTKLIYEN